MTLEQWLELSAAIAALWPHARRLTGDELRVQHNVVRDVDRDQALAAVQTLAREGAEFPPTVGRIRRRLAELRTDAPDWAQVKAWLLDRQHSANVALPTDCPEGLCDGSTWLLDEHKLQAQPCPCRNRRIDQARGAVHPLLKAFVEQVGLAELADVCDDRTAEAQVRHKWERFVNRTEAADYLAGIETAGLPALEHGRRELEPAGSPEGAS